MANKDLAQDITNKVISLLERGNLPAFKKLWSNGGEGYNYSTGKPYQGLNSLLTALATSEGGYSQNAWLTFNQANKLGGRIRKGSAGLALTSYRFVQKTGEGGKLDNHIKSFFTRCGSTITFDDKQKSILITKILWVT